jgi:heme-degrading monooxygenase HmoA
MIVRAWWGYAAPGDAQAYPDHLLHSVRPQLERLPGFRGLFLLRGVQPEEIEYLVLTLWESMEAVQAFAGDTPEHAVVEPEARAALVRFDQTVHYYEVMAAPEVGGVPPDGPDSQAHHQR